MAVCIKTLHSSCYSAQAAFSPFYAPPPPSHQPPNPHPSWSVYDLRCHQRMGYGNLKCKFVKVMIQPIELSEDSRWQRERKTNNNNNKTIAYFLILHVFIWLSYQYLCSISIFLLWIWVPQCTAIYIYICVSVSSLFPSELQKKVGLWCHSYTLLPHMLTLFVMSHTQNARRKMAAVTTMSSWLLNFSYVLLFFVVL